MVCKVCGAKISEGLTKCELCGTSVQTETVANENEITTKTTEEKQEKKENIYADPFWGDSPQKTGDNKSDKDDFDESISAKINRENMKVNDPFAPTTTSTNTVIENNLPNSDYNFNMSSVNSNSGFPNKSKGIILIMIGIIVILVALLMTILLVKNNINKDRIQEDVSQQVQETFDDSVNEEVINEIDTNQIESIIARYSDYTDFGIYVHNLSNDYKYGFNDDSEFLASAMCQVVILDTLSRIVDDNNLNINKEEVFFSYMPNGKEAPTSKNESDTYVSLKKCIEDIAIYGDNNKSNQIVDYIAQINNVNNGFDVINSTLNHNGYTDTHINRKTFVNPDYIDNSVPANTTTPREITDIFENLINHGGFGNKNYMMNIFKSVAQDGKPIGLKKCVPSYYDICNVNALNSQSTNNVAIIGDGNTEIAISILSTTEENKTDVENNEDREVVIEKLMSYILETQFEK